jgi:hypothetical protein
MGRNYVRKVGGLVDIVPGGLIIFMIRGCHHDVRTDSNECVYTVLKLRCMDKGRSIVMCYGLDSLEFEHQWEQGFFYFLHICPDWPKGSPSLLCSEYWGSFLGVK